MKILTGLKLIGVVYVFISNFLTSSDGLSIKSPGVHTENTVKTSPWNTLTGEPPILMAHRGEKVLVPEHTLGAYEIAAILDSEFVEPDLVLTKDGFLVCFHDLTLKDSTDVQERDDLKHLMRENFTDEIYEGAGPKTILNDWFIHDFTLEELQSLKVRQEKKGIRPQSFNQVFNIPTFEEYLELIHTLAYKLGRPIGVVPELKSPKFHNKVWKENNPGSGDNYFETTLLQVLEKYGYPIKENDTENCKHPENEFISVPCGPLIIQSFEDSCLKYLKTQTTAELLMLVDSDWYTIHHLTYKGLDNISNHSSHFSVWKELAYTGIEAELIADGVEYDQEYIDSLGGFIPPQELVSESHKRGLKTSIYTIYDSREPSRRGCAIECEPNNKTEELFYYFDLGVDSIFVENMAESKQILMSYEINYWKGQANKSPDPDNSGFTIQYSVLLLIGCFVVSLTSLSC